MDLGTCTFSPQQRGRVELAADGKSVAITPSGGLGGEMLEKWLRGVKDERKMEAIKEASEPVTLQLVNATNGGADLVRLAAAGLLKIGIDRETGCYCPSRLKAYTSDGSMIVAEFAKGGK